MKQPPLLTIDDTAKHLWIFMTRACCQGRHEGFTEFVLHYLTTLPGGCRVMYPCPLTGGEWEQEDRDRGCMGG